MRERRLHTNLQGCARSREGKLAHKLFTRLNNYDPIEIQLNEQFLIME